jgi:hypothetical protein
VHNLRGVVVDLIDKARTAVVLYPHNADRRHLAVCSEHDGGNEVLSWCLNEPEDARFTPNRPEGVGTNVWTV